MQRARGPPRAGDARPNMRGKGEQPSHPSQFLNGHATADRRVGAGEWADQPEPALPAVAVNDAALSAAGGAYLVRQREPRPARCVTRRYALRRLRKPWHGSSGIHRRCLIRSRLHRHSEVDSGSQVAALDRRSCDPHLAEDLARLQCSTSPVPNIHERVENPEHIAGEAKR